MFTYNASVVAPRVTPKTPLAPFQGAPCPVSYWNGDRVAFDATCPSESGCYVYRFLEGHRKGQGVILSHANAIWGEGR